MTEGPLLVSVAEAARLLGIGRNAVYDLVRRGRLPVVRIGAAGRRILIPRRSLAVWVTHETAPSDRASSGEA